MASEYFQKLREKGRKLDEGIEKLTQTWEMPHLLVGGYGDYTSEAKGYIGDIKKVLKNINVEVDTTLEDVNSTDNLDEQFLLEADLIYHDLKEQCDNLETVLSEYGYLYNGPVELEQKMREDAEIYKEMEKCNISSLNGEPDLEVQFTPDLSWKYKTKAKEHMFTPAHDRSLVTPITANIHPAEFSATPVSRKY